MPQDWFASCYSFFASIKHIIYNLFIVFAIAGIITATIYADNPHDEVNLTREPETTGHDVLETVIDQIRASKIFESDHMYNYIRRIARVESKDWLDDSTYTEGYHGGLWQVDEPIFLVTQDNTSYPILTDKHKHVSDQFDIDWMTLQWRELRVPLWSGVAACLYMCIIDEEIPSSISKQAEHWSRNYNSKKEHPRKPKEFVVEVKELELNTSGTVCVTII